MEHSIEVVLKSGYVITGKYDIDEYDDIYDAWAYKKEIMRFINCEVLVCEVAAIVWEKNAD